MQRGSPMQTWTASHPGSSIDMSPILGWSSGKKVWSDLKKQVAEKVEENKGPTSHLCLCVLKRMQKKQPWWMHQSVGLTSRGLCCRVKCPGLKKSSVKVKQRYRTMMYVRSAALQIMQMCSYAMRARTERCWHATWHTTRRSIQERISANTGHRGDDVFG